MEKNYIDIKKSINAIHKINRDFIYNVLLQESVEEKTGESVPYTTNDELMSSIMETAKAQFGADFNGFTNPMLYYPEDGDVVLSGKIPTLNDMKFQFRFKDQNGGCYIWSSPLTLNKDTLSTLNRIYGVFDNWKNELKTTEDIKPMNLRNN